MGILRNGEWITNKNSNLGDLGWEERREFLRENITADGSSGFLAEAGRYHLVRCPACPHFQTVYIVYKLKKLDNVISSVSTRPILTQNAREFGDRLRAFPDPVTGYKYLYEMYQETDHNYTGRPSVPALWDKQRKCLVSNNTRDIFIMFNSAFNAISPKPNVNFRPDDIADDIDEWINKVYKRIISAVYRMGFATTQKIYDANEPQLYEALDMLEMHLSNNRYLLGNRLTQADWTLLPSLLRFDAIYHILFKCTRRQISNYPSIYGYMCELYQIPGVADTVHMGEAMEHYYLSHKHINPRSILPIMPEQNWHAPHGRDYLPMQPWDV